MAKTNKILKYKEFEIEPFSKMKIGDPEFLEEIENGTADKTTKQLCFVKNRISKTDKRAGVILMKLEHDYDGFLFGSYEIWIQSAHKDLYAALYDLMKQRRIPDNLGKETKLGCDTARFYIATDKNHDTIDMKTDGLFGTAYMYENGVAHQAMLSFDPDLQTEEELEDLIRSLFYVTKESDWKTAE